MLAVIPTVRDGTNQPRLLLTLIMAQFLSLLLTLIGTQYVVPERGKV